jgi:hypothetical protein
VTVPASETIRDVLLGGGFFTGIATIVVALISSGDAQYSRNLQSFEQARIIQSRDYSKMLDSKRDICAAAFHYLEDETPNARLSKEQIGISFQSADRIIQSCGNPTPPPPKILLPELQSGKGASSIVASSNQGEAR